MHHSLRHKTQNNTKNDATFSWNDFEGQIFFSICPLTLVTHTTTHLSQFLQFPRVFLLRVMTYKWKFLFNTPCFNSSSAFNLYIGKKTHLKSFWNTYKNSYTACTCLYFSNMFDNYIFIKYAYASISFETSNTYTCQNNL